MKLQLSALLLTGLGIFATSAVSTGAGSAGAGSAGAGSTGAVSTGGKEPSALSTNTALAAALDTIGASKIGADVRFLACDALAGRNTPGEGLKVAARFLRARLQRLGWESGAGEDYLQTYQLQHDAVDVRRSSFELIADTGKKLKLAFGEDYLFTVGEVWDHRLDAKIVGAGLGEREDMDGVDVDGKWAICLDSGRHAGLRRRLLMKAGALGVIILPNDDLEDQKRMQRIRRSAGYAERGSVSYPNPERDRQAADRPAEDFFHQVYLTLAGASKWSALLGGLTSKTLTEAGRVTTFRAIDTRRLPGEAGRISVENVCGFWPGSDPELSKEVILLSAHYDHVGTKGGEVFNGADDNASGTSGLLAIAEALKHYGPMRRSVMLIWVSAEEKGLFGSQAWVESPTLPSGMRAICNINIDMIGRNAPDGLFITPSEAHRKYNGLVKLASKFSSLEGFEELESADLYYDRSDHANFEKLGIPIAFLFNGEHEDYHKATDTFEKIDTDKIRRVSRLVLRIVDALQTDTLSL